MPTQRQRTPPTCGASTAGVVISAAYFFITKKHRLLEILNVQYQEIISIKINELTV